MNVKVRKKWILGGLISDAKYNSGVYLAVFGEVILYSIFMPMMERFRPRFSAGLNPQLQRSKHYLLCD